MNRRLLYSHLFRAFQRHWVLHAASVTVMTLVLVIMNLLFLGYSGFNSTVSAWGQGLEMMVYLKENASPLMIKAFEEEAQRSGEFDRVDFTPKAEATKKFLEALGPDSLALLSDPKWKSPIPASFELRLSPEIPADLRVAALEKWNAHFQDLEYVDEVFYGQGWVENFSRFLSSASGLVVMIWVLSLSVGFLITSNCIRLSFLQRREEIEILELVGATQRFIRTPFLLEGVVLGLMASVLSLAISFGLHSALLAWLSGQLSFWSGVQALKPMQFWYIAVNLLSGVGFGLLGAWTCVRKLNTGWSAAAG